MSVIFPTGLFLRLRGNNRLFVCSKQWIPSEDRSCVSRLGPAGAERPIVKTAVCCSATISNGALPHHHLMLASQHHTIVHTCWLTVYFAKRGVCINIIEFRSIFPILQLYMITSNEHEGSTFNSLTSTEVLNPSSLIHWGSWFFKRSYGKVRVLVVWNNVVSHLVL